MEAGRAHRARDRAGAFHRPLPACSTTRRPSRMIPSASISPSRRARQDRRRRRLGRRLEEGFLRLGVQEEEARSRQGAGATDPLRRGARKPAAACRLRHAYLPHRDPLDQRSSRDLRVRTRRPRRADEPRPSSRRLPQSGRAALGPNARQAHQGSGGQVPGDFRQRCSIAIPTARRWRISSTNLCSASSPTA